MSLITTPAQREELETATTEYEQHIEQAGAYLAARGISREIAAAARLGVVTDPQPQHQQYVGRLAIPYLTPAGVVDIRYRALTDSGPKYLSMPGHTPRLYNTNTLLTAGNTIAITEGELDALIVTHRFGIPAVGVPGAQAWDDGYYHRIFADFNTVYVWADADEAGQKLADTITHTLTHATVLTLPDGTDATDLYVQHGTEDALKIVGLL